MIENIELENFRGFQELRLKDLARINIIVGRNASGKTAFLESIFLTSGGPALTFKLKSWRGLGDRFEFPLDETRLGNIWQDLFYRFQFDSTARVSLRGSDDVTRSLEIKSSSADAVIVPVGVKVKEAESRAPITFQWFKRKNPISRPIRPVIDGEQLKLEGAPQAMRTALYSSSTPINARESAIWFSDLTKTRKAQPIIDVMRKMFPFIHDLSIEIHSTAPMVHADILELPEKIPLGLVSTGINKLFAMLVAMAHQKVLLIDEIENGIYFDVLPEMWTAIYDFASSSGAQVFASTHSWECLKAASGMVKQHSDDVRLLKLKRQDGKCSARIVDGRDFESALEEDVEVR